jgi:hypothetical protein
MSWNYLAWYEVSSPPGLFGLPMIWTRGLTRQGPLHDLKFATTRAFYVPSASVPYESQQPLPAAKSLNVIASRLMLPMQPWKLT